MTDAVLISAGLRHYEATSSCGPEIYEDYLFPPRATPPAPDIPAVQINHEPPWPGLAADGRSFVNLKPINGISFKAVDDRQIAANRNRANKSKSTASPGGSHAT